MGSVEGRGHLWRSRWAAIGAAVAVTFGAGGLVAVNAAGGVDSTTVLTDPVRVLDSRNPLDVGLAGPFASQVSQKLQITGSIPTTTGTTTVVPPGATGVLLNVTAVNSTASGFISIRPGVATGLPSTSSLNANAGQVVSNAVLVALPTTGTNAGQIDITYDAYGATGPTTDILVDVVGYTSASTPELVCPTGTTLSTGVCIEMTARAAAVQPTAAATCAVEGRRLPSGGELTTFAERPGITLSAGGEWTDDIADITKASDFSIFVVTDPGNGVRQAFTPGPYRCVAGAVIG